MSIRTPTQPYEEAHVAKNSGLLPTAIAKKLFSPTQVKFFQEQRVLVVPVEKKLMDVKIKDLPNWILTQDFTPKGTIRAFQRGYYQYDNKYVNINKGSTLGVSIVLEADVLFNYCVSYKELKHEQLRKNH
ncbi:ATP synthase subunit f, mitochondrial-like [Lagenorhynchus albirostris]|uniref:ATP synthase subunit f, mitochondrial-like n=1 Tax=Lagenorhynchus albirostris TaxID=27610 RepID=UPI0028E7ACAA|nr:ATP synthase subunit f, mitochondrial-like [Lagenorhynchus albirostris]